ncbi:hypothetical protein AAF712_006574 [Marasmius tenuissimus]|uniref:DJ-1/PfpI domain-containing protein n=1 Tax=Marasmius tenuissimus TaxID=585030 RepID=A0ABR2ZXT6_9AGAR
MSSELKVCRLAVYLYPNATMTDFQGPIELFCCFNTTNRKLFGSFFKHLPDAGPKVLPSMTYEEGMKTDFDIILIPGGRPYTGPSPKEGPPDIREFLKKKGPETKYVLSVCTGSWQLAYIGLLEGKRATTNKASYNSVVEDTKDLNITWVPKARWVVNDDKHIWISSGVAAGIDLAYAFSVHLFGEKLADEAKGLIEFSTSKDADHDKFATFYGLA